MHLRNLLIVSLLSVAYAQDRLLTAKLNPGCPDCDSLTTLIYIRAEGHNDTIHQIWDFSRGAPTVIYAIGSQNSTMFIEWKNKAPSNFHFLETLIYSFAAEIDRLYEYEDCHDLGHIDEKCPHYALPLKNVVWSREASVLNTNEVMISMHGLYEDHWRAGIVDMKLDLLPFKDYAKELPHLIHTANSTLIDISLVNFTSTTNASRYAIHYVLASTEKQDDKMIFTMRKSLDDEHTPGVFEIIEVRTPKSYLEQAGGFFQFRPVAYTEQERTVSSSTNAYISPFGRKTLSNETTMGRFYQRFKPARLLVQDMFISFGLPGDGYYKQHNFTSWSYSYGYGTPPVESVSTFVIAIISVGLAVPCLLAFSGVAYAFHRRSRRNEPQMFYDEDNDE